MKKKMHKKHKTKKGVPITAESIGYLSPGFLRLHTFLCSFGDGFRATTHNEINAACKWGPSKTTRVLRDLELVGAITVAIKPGTYGVAPRREIKANPLTDDMAAPFVAFAEDRVKRCVFANCRRLCVERNNNFRSTGKYCQQHKRSSSGWRQKLLREARKIKRAEKRHLNGAELLRCEKMAQAPRFTRAPSALNERSIPGSIAVLVDNDLLPSSWSEYDKNYLDGIGAWSGVGGAGARISDS